MRYLYSMITKTYLNTKEAAAHLGITQERLLDLVDDNNISVPRYVSGGYKFSSSSLRKVRTALDRDRAGTSKRETKRIAKSNRKLVNEILTDITDIDNYVSAQKLAIAKKLQKLRL